MSNKRNGMLVYVLLLTVAFSFRVAVASLLPNDEPLDSQVYIQIARNLREQGVYSDASGPPYSPTLKSLPGYPFFLAGVYSIFGHGDNQSVRNIQALLDTAACVLIAFIAFRWEPNKKLKRRSAIAGFVLAGLCPFTTIYVATILPETPTVFLTMVMTLTATFALQANRQRNTLLLWMATGLIAGLAVLFRPDNGFFAAAIGITLVVTTLMRTSDLKLRKKGEEVLYRFSRASYLGAVFSLTFCVVLIPWTMRNFRVFRIFQPLAPAHAEMPGEFVPRGYRTWLRTWIDDGRYVGPVLWALNEAPIKLESFPDHAFDSAQEKLRVAALLEKYNYPVDAPESTSAQLIFQDTATPSEDEKKATEEDESKTDDEMSQENPDAESDQSEELDQSEETGEVAEVIDQPVQMTLEIDAGFTQIARERISRNPLRHFLLLPARRALSLWFDTHSQFYPFEGELLPLVNLDREMNQHFWLPLFAGLTFIYTLLGIAGGWFLWQSREFVARQWLLLTALMIFLRIGYFATLENPEPRYVVEVFPFLAILGGIAFAHVLARISDRTFYFRSASGRGHSR